jgi:hypothetical protein
MNTRFFGLLAGCAALALMNGSAHAATCAYNGTTINFCGDLPNPTYVSGSTAVEPLHQVLGKSLITATSPTQLVYIKGGTEGSCSGVNRLVAVPAEKLTHGLAAKWVNDAGTSCDCVIGKDNGQNQNDNSDADITVAVSDVYPQTCGVTLPAGLKDFTGPINAMTFVVPAQSSKRAISFEEAFLIFGFGGMYNVAPWLDKMFFFIRPQYSGTLRMLGSYIGISPTKWQGTSQDTSVTPAKDFGSGDVFNHITAATANPDQYIGILGLDFLLAPAQAANVSKLKVLAFRGAGQRYAYYPDSTPTAKDKRNVRDGHYMPWGPVHMIAAVNSPSDTTPSNPLAQKLIALVQGENANLNDGAAKQPSLDAIIGSNFIPACAMKVNRSVDGADMSLYTPDQACDCYYEKKVATPAVTCFPQDATKDCSATNPCATGTTCRRGFCESR